MIQVLGTRRIAILLALLVFNGVLGYFVFMHLAPQHLIKQRELGATQGEVSTLRNDISDLQIEFDQLDFQREEFNALKRDGFFDGQSRRKAELIFQKVQERSGVISAVVSVKAGEFEDSEQAKKAEHKILSSPISVRIEAVNDLDVFRYLYLVEEFFPGHVSIKNIKFSRESDVSGTVLRAIASGQNPPLVIADLELTWRTMIPDDGSNVNTRGGRF
jgi:hypothetical protein